jgi:CRP/FNR family transcriptional regulator
MLKKLISFIFLDKEIKNDVVFLKQIDAFKMFTQWQLKKITTVLYKRLYLKNEYIYKKGEPAKIVYLLKSGKVELSDGKTKNIVEPNTMFGERSLLCASDVYLKDAKSIEKSELYMIHKEDLESLMERDTGIGYKIIKVLLENFYNKA